MKVLMFVILWSNWSFATSFSEHCKNPKNRDIAHTVSVLLEDIGVSDCDKAEEYLSTVTSITLDSKDIVSLEPFSELIAISELILEFNLIEDISPLKNLCAMSILDLSYNRIRDISALEKLTLLKDLKINSDDGFLDLKVLENLIYLENLSISGDSIVDISRYKI